MQRFFVFANTAVKKIPNPRIDTAVKLQDMAFRDFFIDCEQTEDELPFSETKRNALRYHEPNRSQVS
jgi:hypothetical protein